jgi:hypothetical protein
MNGGSSRRQSWRAIRWLFLVLLSPVPGNLAARDVLAAETGFRTEGNVDEYPLEPSSGQKVWVAFHRAIAADWNAVRSQPPGEWKRLEDRQIGYALLYPSEWSVEGQVAATEFAIGSRCRSVRVVDYGPPSGSGPGAEVRQSFVQVCGKPIEDGKSLEDFMRRTYGDKLARTFVMADFNGLSVYRSREEQPTRTIFTEMRNHRIQIYCSVVADLEKSPMRRVQVENILASFAAI